MSYDVQNVKPLEENLWFVMLACINKVELTKCSYLSIHSDETLLIECQVFNAAVRVTMQQSI